MSRVSGKGPFLPLVACACLLVVGWLSTAQSDPRLEESGNCNLRAFFFLDEGWFPVPADEWILIAETETLTFSSPKTIILDAKAVLKYNPSNCDGVLTELEIRHEKNQGGETVMDKAKSVAPAQPDHTNLQPAHIITGGFAHNVAAGEHVYRFYLKIHDDCALTTQHRWLRVIAFDTCLTPDFGTQDDS